ncbi:hypothetical protein BH20BAC1_BH20BAC1_09040 [soil metagenome]
MKTSNITDNNIAESLKRLLYSFQVLIVGIAIPVLFMMGISTKTPKNDSVIKPGIEKVHELTFVPHEDIILIKI